MRQCLSWEWSLSTRRQCARETVPAAVEGGVGVAAAGGQEFAVVDEGYVHGARRFGGATPPARASLGRPSLSVYAEAIRISGKSRVVAQVRQRVPATLSACHLVITALLIG
ncbi:hypothetical protein GCM10023214_62010 [Amycolatopsis dongchuanensis]|uniref:Uncharacterized protein n=1 Tax=Amycolatopsis dongchuanensis TaxID=1070866 RepID=A0ABP8VER1_9PSEU